MSQTDPFVAIDILDLPLKERLARIGFRRQCGALSKRLVGTFLYLLQDLLQRFWAACVTIIAIAKGRRIVVAWAAIHEFRNHR